jgi:hypothetical protein
MPHVTGLGHIDWYFTGQKPEEVTMIPEFRAQIPGVQPCFFPSDGAPAEGRPFWWYPDWGSTQLYLLLRSDEPLPPVNCAFLNQTAEVNPDGEFPHQLRRFRKLLDLTARGKRSSISFMQVDEGIVVDFSFKGRVRSPEKLMRGICRRLSRP